RWLLMIGGTVTALFVVVRAINIYGDAAKWSPQRNAIFTLLSFLNTTKYPPSLLFLLMTLGPSIMLLALFESRSSGNVDAGSFGRHLREFFVTLRTRAALLLPASVVHGAFDRSAFKSGVQQTNPTSVSIANRLDRPSAARHGFQSRCGLLLL